MVSKKGCRSNDVYFGPRTVIFFLRKIVFHFDHYLSRRSNSLNIIQTKVGFRHSRRILLVIFRWLLIMQGKGQALGRNGNYASARTDSDSGVLWHKGSCSISNRNEGCNGNDDVLLRQVGNYHGKCWIVNPKIGTKWSIRFSVVLFFFPNDIVCLGGSQKTISWGDDNGGAWLVDAIEESISTVRNSNGYNLFVRFFEFKMHDRSTCKLAITFIQTDVFGIPMVSSRSTTTTGISWEFISSNRMNRILSQGCMPKRDSPEPKSEQGELSHQNAPGNAKKIFFRRPRNTVGSNWYLPIKTSRKN